MLNDIDMTALELIMLARAVCESRLDIASEPFRHFNVSVVGDKVCIVAVK